MKEQFSAPYCSATALTYIRASACRPKADMVLFNHQDDVTRNSLREDRHDSASRKYKTTYYFVRSARASVAFQSDMPTTPSCRASWQTLAVLRAPQSQPDIPRMTEEEAMCESARCGGSKSLIVGRSFFPPQTLLSQVVCDTAINTDISHAFGSLWNIPVFFAR